MNHFTSLHFTSLHFTSLHFANNIFIKKRYVILLLFLLGLFNIYSAPKSEVPEWMSSVKKVYPDSDFLAQKGSGKKPELAKTDALSNLSRYFQTTIESNLSTTFSSMEDRKRALQKTEVLSTVNLSSNMNMFGVELSQVYYQKKEKLYYCVAYIDRAYAWKIYEPSIIKEKKTFYEFYDEAIKQSENDPLHAIKYYVNAKECGDIFLAMLDYGRLINEKKERSYSIDRDNVATILKLKKDAVEKSILFLKANQNEGNIILPKIEKSLSDIGFICSQTSQQSLYVVDIDLNSNMTIEEEGTEEAIYIVDPVINIVISNKSTGRIIYSWVGKSKNKSIAYSKESALKKACNNLWDYTGNEFTEDFYAVVYGEKI